jgi:hypothetical protein
MNNELQRMWKDMPKAESEVLSQTSACRDWGEARKMHVRTATLRAHIRTSNTTKTKQKCQLLSHNIWSLHILNFGFLEWENKITEPETDDH